MDLLLPGLPALAELPGEAGRTGVGVRQKNDGPAHTALTGLCGDSPGGSTGVMFQNT